MGSTYKVLLSPLHCIALQMIIISQILRQLDGTGLDPFLPPSNMTTNQLQNSTSCVSSSVPGPCEWPIYPMVPLLVHSVPVPLLVRSVPVLLLVRPVPLLVLSVPLVQSRTYTWDVNQWWRTQTHLRCESTVENTCMLEMWINGGEHKHTWDVNQRWRIQHELLLMSDNKRITNNNFNFNNFNNFKI